MPFDNFFLLSGQKDHYYLQNVERNADSALRLLKHMPVAKEAVFEYYSFVIDLLATQEFAKASSRNTAPLTNALEKLHKDLLELMRHPKLGKDFIFCPQEILRDFLFQNLTFVMQFDLYKFTHMISHFFLSPQSFCVVLLQLVV